MKAGRLVRIGVCLGVLTMLASACARAQSTMDVRSVSNQYIEIQLGISGTVNAGSSVTYPVGGHFGVWAVEGNPLTSADDGQPLLDGVQVNTSPSTPTVSEFTVRVQKADGTWEDLVVGRDADGAWSNLNADDIKDKIVGVWTMKAEPIEVALQFSIVRDTARFQFVVKNNDTQTRRIGMRILYAPYIWRVPLFVAGAGRVTSSQEWTGGDVPPFWRGFKPTDDPDITMIGINRGLDATVPERFAIGGMLDRGDWNLPTTPPSDTVTGLSPVVALWWEPTPMTPGDTGKKTIVTYFGPGCASEDFTLPYVLATQAPFSLDYTQMFPSGDWSLSPNPFRIRAYVDNTSAADFYDANLTLNLPEGLALVGGETATKSVPLVPRGQEAEIGWDVYALDTTTGVLKYSVSCTATPVNQAKIVFREIGISATNTHAYGQGWAMFGAPFSFLDKSPATALGLEDGTYRILDYNPTTNSYNTALQIVPGKGYWVQSAATATVDIPKANSAPVTPKTAEQQQIPLSTGWNLIADPYITPYGWRNVKVLQDLSDPDQPVTIDQAMSRGWLRKTLYWWDPVIGPQTGSYSWSSNTNTIQLMPWLSYWVKANTACTLILDAPMLGDWYGVNTP